MSHFEGFKNLKIIDAMKRIWVPGEDICYAEGLIKGHGTDYNEDKITSAYFGDVKQINKLITVEPFYSQRYVPETGDVIIGRVTKIFNKKWFLETNSKNETSLSLSSINLPGVMQRRKSEDDEINMHTFFDVNDLVVCEVQKVSKSSTAALHKRNDKYGKLGNGMLIFAPHRYLMTIKSRFITKDKIEVIVGCNGFIWIKVKNDCRDSYLIASKIGREIQAKVKQQEIVDVEKIVEDYYF